jgi:transposase
MGRSRRQYSAEFKREAVEMTLVPGRTLVEVADNLGISRGLLQRWKSHLKAGGAKAFAENGRTKASDEELLRLRNELARTRQERDILKKALAYFAQERN